MSLRRGYTPELMTERAKPVAKKGNRRLAETRVQELAKGNSDGPMR